MSGFNDTSGQEKIISVVLLAGIVFIILFMFTPANVRQEGSQAAAAAKASSQAKQGTFSTPRDLTVDDEGNVYVVDSRNHRIQKFNRDGSFLAMWGKEGDTNGKFKEPCGIDMGPDNNVYVCDTWNARVQVFTKTGRFIRDFGKDTGLWGPRDVGIDHEGNAYVLDTGNCKIEKFDKEGKHIGTFGSRGSGKLQFIEPFSIQRGPDKNLYIADRKNFRIQVMTTSGKYVREFKIDGWAEGQIVNGCLMEPYISIDQKRKYIYVTDSTNHKVLRFDLQGNNKKVFEKDAKGIELFGCPLSVAVGLNNKIFVTDSGQGKLVSFMDN